MKKAIIVALLCLSGLVEMSAQVSFKPGIRAGLNLSHFTKGDFDNYDDTYYYDEYYNDYVFAPVRRDDRYKSKADLYVGIYGALKLTKYYTLQPEIIYSRQGTNFEYREGGRIYKEKLDVSYLSVGIVNKFTFGDKFNIHVGPTVDILVDENFVTSNEVDFAFMLGAGFNFTKNFGIEARIKKGVIPVLDYSSSHSNVVFQTGITYTFDVK